MMFGMKQLVNNVHIHEAFLDFIQSRIKTNQVMLEQAVNIHDVYRLQGQITALRRLLTIRDEINTLDKGGTDDYLRRHLS